VLVDGDDGVAGGALEFGVDEFTVDGLAGFCVDHADGDGLGHAARTEDEPVRTEEKRRSNAECVRRRADSAPGSADSVREATDCVHESLQRGPHRRIIGVRGRVLL
jgi:hypothetical protein